MRMHNVALTDHYMNIGERTYEGKFWEINQQLTKYELREANPDFFFKTQVLLKAESQTHERGVYGIIDLLGDLGGQLELFVFVFGVFMFPMSEHSFTLKAAKKLFLARTKDKGMFLKVQDNQKYAA